MEVTDQQPKQIHVCEVFCGTKSFSKICLEFGWSVTTLDHDPKFQPDILYNILDWDYKSFPVPDVFWAGIPCQTYSMASFKRRPDLGNLVALKTLEILEYFLKLNPRLIYGLENPWSSLLKKQTFMQGIPYVKCDYCSYGFPYRKSTMIFGNIKWTGKLCLGPNKCPAMVGTHHICTAQQGRQTLKRAPLQQETWTRDELYTMPPLLCYDLVRAIDLQIHSGDGRGSRAIEGRGEAS